MNGNWHWAWVSKRKQEPAWTLANMRTNMLSLKEPDNKEAVFEIKERNEERDAVNSSILPNWAGAPKASPKIRAMCFRAPKSQATSFFNKDRQGVITQEIPG